MTRPIGCSGKASVGSILSREWRQCLRSTTMTLFRPSSERGPTTGTNSTDGRFPRGSLSYATGDDMNKCCIQQPSRRARGVGPSELSSRGHKARRGMETTSPTRICGVIATVVALFTAGCSTVDPTRQAEIDSRPWGSPPANTVDEEYPLAAAIAFLLNSLAR